MIVNQSWIRVYLWEKEPELPIRTSNAKSPKSRKQYSRADFIPAKLPPKGTPFNLNLRSIGAVLRTFFANKTSNSTACQSSKTCRITQSQILHLFIKRNNGAEKKKTYWKIRLDDARSIEWVHESSRNKNQRWGYSDWKDWLARYVRNHRNSLVGEWESICRVDESSVKIFLTLEVVGYFTGILLNARNEYLASFVLQLQEVDYPPRFVGIFNYECWLFLNFQFDVATRRYTTVLEVCWGFIGCLV